MNEDSLSKLERLAKLKEQGVLTDAEFNMQKAAILQAEEKVEEEIQESKTYASKNVAQSTTVTPAHSQVTVKESNKSAWKWLAGIFIGLLLLSLLLPGNKQDLGNTTTTNLTDIDTSLSSTTPVPVEPSEPTNSWSYYSDTDKMGSKYHIASIDAKEPLEFDFPYNGGSIASFTVRKKKGETDIYLKVSKGQFISNSAEDGSARIRFDDGKPVTYSTSGAADYSSDIIFFNATSSLISKLKKSKKMVIEVEFYSEGTRQIEFNTAGFKWNR
ncbi:SHOCT domain-containing protein [Spirosoma pulveris]